MLILRWSQLAVLSPVHTAPTQYHSDFIQPVGIPRSKINHTLQNTELTVKLHTHLLHKVQLANNIPTMLWVFFHKQSLEVFCHGNWSQKSQPLAGSENASKLSDWTLVYDKKTT